MKELLFTTSKDNGDFIVQPFKGTGKGGQKRNKTMSCCRIIHQPSGARAESQEERSFYQNKDIAFDRLIKTDTFQKWLKLEIARVNGELVEIERSVEANTRNKNLLIEVQENGLWKPEA